ncbi:hypothetical protein U9M48_015367 [Paspalum notatum var. saurae]|uniref:Abnormal spindle-like microcephaly-associated protein n=1 Tax=Paspalum notatum var. saurae TaxID=547442 RepID=A0AAQ3T3N6_PASNO
MRAWSDIILKRNHNCLTNAASTLCQARGNYDMYFTFIMERHRFVQMRKSAIMIQQAVRIWIKIKKSLRKNGPSESSQFVEVKTKAPSPQEHCSGEDKTKASCTSLQHCTRVDASRAYAAPHILCFDGMNNPDSTTPLQLRDKQSNSTTATQPCKSGHDSIPPPSSLSSMFEGSYPLCEMEMSEDVMVCISDVSSEALFGHEQLVSTCNDFPVCKELVAAQRIQSAYRRFVNDRNLRITAVIKIQSHWRCYSVRKCFTKQVQAIVGIQNSIRLFLYHQSLQHHQIAAVLIQRVVRGWLARKRLLGSSLQAYTRFCVLDQCQQRKCHQSLELKIVLHSIVRLQRWWREFWLHRSVQKSVISIQSFVRGWLARKQLNRIFCCINIIQRWWRKVKFLESRKRAVIVIQTHCRGWIARQDAIRTRNCLKVQRWWRKVLLLKSRKHAVIIIQAYCRGWIARQAAIRTRKSITIIQSYVKAYLVRKASKQSFESAAQVDDCLRLINRLSQLRHRRSIHSIRRTCTALSTATGTYKKCCETIVTARALDVLLKQIHSRNRGIPDQEVSEQVLLTLRNIARYPDLGQVLANTKDAAEIILQELLRNKSDGFFIASDILKKLCEHKEGHETTQVLCRYIKRLRSLVQDLEKKVELDRRNGRTGAMKANNLRWLREAATLYHLFTSEIESVGRYS